MWDKIKKYALYVLTPVLVIGGYIYYLLSELSKLQAQVGMAKAEKQLVQILDKKDEAEVNATIKETDYRSVRDAYLKQQRDGGPESDSKS